MNVNADIDFAYKLLKVIGIESKRDGIYHEKTLASSTRTFTLWETEKLPSAPWRLRGDVGRIVKKG